MIMTHLAEVNLSLYQSHFHASKQNYSSFCLEREVEFKNLRAPQGRAF